MKTLSADRLLKPYQDTITNIMYLGLLPFFVGALGPWIFAQHEIWLSNVFLFYSSILYTFLAGTIWSMALFAHDDSNQVFIKRHIYAAIVLSLIPLASYFLSAIYNTGIMLLAFLSLLFWEKLFLDTLYPYWYQQLRHRLTFIVIACHLLVIGNIIRT